jgi:hypothetical protein
MTSDADKYWLSPHVHVCLTADGAVLLDLRRDKYLGIGREHTAMLGAVIVGWPAGVEAGLVPSPGVEKLLQQMVSTGLLTHDPQLGKEARCPDIGHPSVTLMVTDLDHRPRTSARDALRVSMAAARARTLLKWRSLESVVARVRERKQRSATGELDLHAARPLVEAFLYWRPLFFTSKDECLFDSLVLLELLARHRLYPDWLFGVSTRPFRAHSWVQAGACVLNDLPERVARFTPILAV